MIPLGLFWLACLTVTLELLRRAPLIGDDDEL